MKILHFSDLHLGVETYGHTVPETGLSSRLHDILSAFDRLVDYALENRVDLVIFCGDTYKTREPGQTQQREFARRLSRLSSGGIPVFLLIGNHDLPNAFGRATATEIFDTLAVENVYVSNKPGVYRIPTAGGTVQVVSLPWPRRSALLGREETRNLNLEQIKERLQQALTAAIEVNVARLDPSLPAVLAAHVWVTGATVGSEKMMTIGQEPALLLSNVARPEFDYVALGHIHRHQVLSENPPVVYAGSLESLDFNDEGDEKGFYLVNIAPGEETGSRRVSFHFHPLAGRRFITVDAAIGPEDIDPTATVLKAISARAEEIRGAIVRLNITLPAHVEGHLSYADIRNALKDASYFTVARDVQREARRRLGGQAAAEEITPLDALKAYLDSEKVSTERAKVLLEYGEKLIREEMER